MMRTIVILVDGVQVFSTSEKTRQKAQEACEVAATACIEAYAALTRAEVVLHKAREANTVAARAYREAREIRRNTRQEN